MFLRVLARTIVATGLSVALAGSALVFTSSTAHAETTEVYPDTVTADALPTVQVNGVVWDQAIIGNTVYAVGNFSTARPAGSAGGANTVARSNMLAYNLTTGALISSFAPTFNGQIQSVSATPDGSRLYVAGQFTTVNNTARNRLAAIDPSSGALITSFTVGANATVYSVHATASAIYIGGNFTSVGGGNARMRAAAINPANNTVLPFAPNVGDRSVRGIAAYGDKVAIGGNFTTVNGSGNPGYGLALLDAATGATLPMAANTTIRNAGDDAAIWSLRGDSTGIYGVGYHFGGGGTAEGSFRIDWNGNTTWIDDCHGDTYDVVALGNVAYQASHKHYCGNLGTGGFPQTEPDWTFYRATATTNYATGLSKPDIYGYPDQRGGPSPTMLPWFPALNSGSFTGMNQGPWTVEGNADYVIMGGEFTTANGTGQQGLVRFARNAIAPKAQGPRLSGNAMQPSLRSLVAGGVKATWPANWDRDDDTLTYRLQRLVNNQWVTVKETTQRARFWEGTPMTFFETGLTPGANVTYRVQTADPDGNVTTSATAAVQVATTGTLGAYGQAVYDDGATKYWRLGESDNSVVDWAGSDDRTTGSGNTRGAAGALLNSSDAATTFDNSGNGVIVSNQALQGPDTFSYEVWFKTNTSTGGKIVGFGNATSGNSSNYDRHLYMDNAGRVTFGVWTGQAVTVSSGTGYNDNQWHQAVASLGSNGLALYLDGRRIGTNASTTAGQSYNGYWRLGGDSAWAGDNHFDGQIDEFSLYPTQLTRQQVNAHWVASGRTSTIPPRPSDAYGQGVYDAEPDLYWRLGESSGTTAQDTSSAANPGTYAGSYALGASGVAGSNTAILLGDNSTVVASKSVDNPTVFSQEVWIKTNTTTGGRIFGFGRSGTPDFSNSYDRQLWMLDDGRVVFGTWTGQENRVTSTSALNDNAWHHVVSLLGPNGMKMYVDGQLVSSNANTGAESYPGFWRLGGDNAWGGNSSAYFHGTVDEAAIYSRNLTAQEVEQHFLAGGGDLPNTPPTAAFTATPAGLNVTFNSAGSGDAEGPVTYAWDFGDGATSTDANPTHTYAGGGTFGVSLTVTDQRGATATATHLVVVTAPNGAPVAGFTSQVDGLEVAFTDTSTDADGTVTAWAWEFGDGATSTQRNPSHTYANGTVRSVKLTVTDNDGAQSSVTRQVDPNAAPTASFTASVNSRTVAFNASASNDPDGTIAQYAWDFGDGQTGTGTTPSHTYTSDGDFTVTLKVTDNDGATDTTTRSVTTTAPPANQAFAKDTFTRSVNGGWGSADTGGAWTVSGTAANWQVANGVGTVDLPAAGNGRTALLSAVSSSDTEFTGTFSVDKASTGGGQYVNFMPRAVNASNVYRTKVLITSTGALRLELSRVVGGTETTLGSTTVAGLTAAAGDTFSVRAKASGVSPTNLAGKVWRAGSAEPSAWQIERTDSSAGLQVAAGVGLYAYLSGSTTNAPIKVTFDDLNATSTAPPTPNQPPASDFTSAATGGRVQFTSTATDPDGTIASRSWNFGDGGTSTATNPVHDYASSGTYTVTLTVTDDDGATDTRTRQVEVTVPPNQAPVASFTATVNGTSVAFDGSGSTDADGQVTSWTWNFGDGSPTATGATTSHTYAPGTYTATLSVVDDDGASHQTTRSVTVAAGPAVLARDAFGRTVANGFGTSDQGGAWTTSGTASNFSVSGGGALIRMGSAGTGPRALLGAVGSANTDSKVSVSLDKVPAGGDTYITLAARRNGNSEYRLKARFQPTATMLLVSRVIDNTETTLASTTLPAAARYQAGDAFTLRFLVDGTALRGRLWRVGETEPASWQVQTTDSSAALSGAGGIALQAYLSSAVTNAPVVARFDDLEVTGAP